MNFKLMLSPLPLPSFLNETSNLKLILGLALFLGGALVFSMWKERLSALKEDEKAKFLMFNVVGGSWLIAVFAVCSGIYFLFDSVLKFNL